MLGRLVLLPAVCAAAFTGGHLPSTHHASRPAVRMVVENPGAAVSGNSLEVLRLMARCGTS